MLDHSELPRHTRLLVSPDHPKLPRHIRILVLLDRPRLRQRTSFLPFLDHPNPRRGSLRKGISRPAPPDALSKERLRLQRHPPGIRTTRRTHGGSSHGSGSPPIGHASCCGSGPQRTKPPYPYSPWCSLMVANSPSRRGGLDRHKRAPSRNWAGTGGVGRLHGIKSALRRPRGGVTAHDVDSTRSKYASWVACQTHV